MELRYLPSQDLERHIAASVRDPLHDQESGMIYVLRSESDIPLVAEHRDVLHKIGVTSGSVDRRIGNAKVDPTYLLTDVEIVATYKLFGINRAKLENLVPRFEVDEAVERIKDGTIANFVYDPKQAKFRPREGEK